MKDTIQHPVYGEIVYNENFWSGKKTITVNGIEAQKVSKNEYMLNDKKAILKGSYLSGVCLEIEGKKLQLSAKTKWYEYVLAALPLAFLMTWGNSVELCSIFPVVGGALGGFLGGVCMVLSIFFMKKSCNPIIKVLIGIGATLAALFLGFIFALVLIQLIY